MANERFSVIVAGSRGFDDYAFMERKLYRLFSRRKPTSIVSGHARGADRMGEEYARNRGLSCDMFPADWERYGRSAGYRRNEEMLCHADALVAFWDGKSRGTKHMIDIAGRKGIPVRVVLTAKGSAA